MTKSLNGCSSPGLNNKLKEQSFELNFLHTLFSQFGENILARVLIFHGCSLFISRFQAV